jgi:hypothetical protein
MPIKSQKIIRECLNTSNKPENLEVMDKLLDAYELFKLNKNKINIINRTTMRKKIEVVIVSQ